MKPVKTADSVGRLFTPKPRWLSLTPWVMSRSPKVGYNIHDNSGNWVARVNDLGDGESHARLIIAAPDLLEVVRELASIDCYELDGPGSDGEDACRVCNAKAALVKVTGGKS
jgi:hypothetical protein